MSHALVQQLHQKAIPVYRVCELLGISRSGYYEFRERLKRPVKVCEQRVHLKAAFAASGNTYGSRRLHRAMADRGLTLGRYRIRSLMRVCQLKPVWKPKFIHTTNSKHDMPVAENILNREFAPVQANSAWVADITYIRTRSGWLYLAAVLDLYSRKIIGWAMAAAMPAKLVCQALHMAVSQRRPRAGLIVHSDQGSQYASKEYQELLAAHGLCCSMSRTGNCWDNAVMERFFLNLKMERVWQRDYANHMEATRDITDYIVGFYNSTRLHSTLGYLSPNAYESKMASKEPI